LISGNAVDFSSTQQMFTLVMLQHGQQLREISNINF
jgi:hypothetical protein